MILGWYVIWILDIVDWKRNGTETMGMEHIFNPTPSPTPLLRSSPQLVHDPIHRLHFVRIHPTMLPPIFAPSCSQPFGLESLERDVERRLVVANLAGEGVNRFSPHGLAGIVQGEGDEGGDGADDEELKRKNKN